MTFLSILYIILKPGHWIFIFSIKQIPDSKLPLFFLKLQAINVISKEPDKCSAFCCLPVSLVANKKIHCKEPIFYFFILPFVIQSKVLLFAVLFPCQLRAVWYVAWAEAILPEDLVVPVLQWNQASFLKLQKKKEEVD